MNIKCPDHYVMVDPTGVLRTSLTNQSLASTIADCAFHGLNHLKHQDRTWSLYNDGQWIIAFSAITSSNQAKSLNRTIRRFRLTFDRSIVKPVLAAVG